MSTLTRQDTVSEHCARCPLLCIIRYYAYVGVLGSEGLGTIENVVKSGTFPYMAIVYYTDDTILEGGKRFVRNAILIRPDWLVSAAIDVHGNTTFPRKTLVARAGADTIDVNFTLSEEDLEQDREIIQVVQPSKVKMDTWKYDTFLSLLKTLVSFNITSVVAPTALAENNKYYAGKTCFILVFGYPNNSADQIFMRWPVEILPQDSCKTNDDSFICSNYNTSATDELSLCPRNRGGPLVCEEAVVGVQSYLSGCQQPQLHIALAAWREFIECGVKEQCDSNPCNNTCFAYDKDPPATIGALRTNMMTIDTTTTPTDLTNDVARRNFVPDVKNETLVATNESNFAFLKEEIKRTSDIVAANLDTDTTSSAYEQTELVTNLTNQSAIAPDGTIFIRIEMPTRTVDLKIRNISTKVAPKIPVARTRLTANQASIRVVQDSVFIMSFFSVFFM